MKFKHLLLFIIATIIFSAGCSANKKNKTPIEPPIVKPIEPPIEQPIVKPIEQPILVPVDIDPVDKKPIIYLYPTEKTEINVRLDYVGELTTTYPKYDAKKGWSVIAEPNGTLHEKDSNKEFYALYWEGIRNPYKYPETGFVVKGIETADFLDEKLAVLGLNARERNEFIIYWLPEMEHNAYNFIHFAGKSYTDNAMLTITPKPETLIRVFMEFSALEKPTKVQPQILEPVERKGFTVVEWGGSELKEHL